MGEPCLRLGKQAGSEVPFRGRCELQVYDEARTLRFQDLMFTLYLCMIADMTPEIIMFVEELVNFLSAMAPLLGIDQTSP